MTESDRPIVWIDGQVFENQFQVGIWRTFYEVLSRAPETSRVVLWLRDRPAQPIPSSVRVIRDGGRIPARGWDLVARARRKLSRLRIPSGLQRAGVFHAPYFATCPTPEPAMVTTIYDMIAEDHSTITEFWAHDVSRKRAAILGASRIIAISEATRAELLRFYPQVKDRVRVVPLGADHLIPINGPQQKVEQPHRNEKYAVFVGHRGEYKNFRLVLDALAHPAWPRGIGLHIIGPPLSEPEKKWIQCHNLADRIREFGRVTDSQLRGQYAAAECFIFPSLIEGFGLPVLEAQACGCPAVISDIPVFREVAGGAAVYFDPRLAERLAEAVAAVEEPDIRRQMAEAGLVNVRRFSWNQTAEQWFEVYSEAARVGGRGN
jgi:glycosyltransferase involved in cell wall biosynthesis